MALPFLLLPVLGAAIGAALNGVVFALANFMTRQIAYRLVVLGLFAAATTAFVTLLYGLAQGLRVALPSIVVTAASWVLPDNVFVCIGAYMAAQVAKGAYSYLYWGWNISK